MDAVQALQEYHRSINDSVLKRAEELAIERSKRDGYNPAITGHDVLQACNEDYQGKPETEESWVEIWRAIDKHGLYHDGANDNQKYSVEYSGHRYQAPSTKALVILILESIEADKP